MERFRSFRQWLADCDREIAHLSHHADRWPHRLASERARRAAIEMDRRARGKRLDDKLRWHEMLPDALAQIEGSDDRDAAYDAVSKLVGAAA